MLLPQRSFHRHDVRHPRVMKSGGIHRFTRRELVFQVIDQQTKQRIDDRATTRATSDQYGTPLFRHNHRSHRAEHPFPRCGQIGLGPNESLSIRDSWLGVKIPHFIIQEIARPAHHNSRTKALFQRVGIGDRHPFTVDDAEMGSLCPLVPHQDLGP